MNGKNGHVVFLGAGNVATHLSLALFEKGYHIKQIYSRREETAKELARKVNASFTHRTEEIVPNADLYIFSLKDSVLPEIIRRMPVTRGIWIHTAGSIPMDVFSDSVRKYGVFYPLQTFSKNRKISFSGIPICLEASDEETLRLLTHLAESISGNIHFINSEKRRYLHLAAVFSCNFVNYMYDIGSEILRKEEIPFDILLPLIDETASKVRTLSPFEAQTGPAVRYDRNVMDKHLHLLENEKQKEIYRLLSEEIHVRHSNS
ncbi:MAG: DUF2520 domain-containing protein [Candidatus Azobacteroides sp.]|nr:DUF2520 domain-containing protein [Candidatus Azobacteroides sp.]